MTKKHLIRRIGTALTAVVLALCVPTACESVECPLNNTVYTTYGFYTSADGELTAVRLTDTLTVTAAGTDSVLLNRLYNAAQIELPMSYFSAEDTLSFAFTDAEGSTWFDTVYVSKYNYEHYESPGCPTAMFHYISGVRSTHRAIDTVMVVNPNVNYYASENFKIIFRSAD